MLFRKDAIFNCYPVYNHSLSMLPNYTFATSCKFLAQKTLTKAWYESDMVLSTYNPAFGNWGQERNSRLTLATKRAQGQPGLHKTLFQSNKQRKKKIKVTNKKVVLYLERQSKFSSMKRHSEMRRTIKTGQKSH